MSRSKVLTTICVVLLTAPVLAVLGNASAQDPVPGASGINWSAQVNHETRLYLGIPNVTTPSPGAPVDTQAPNCADSASSGKLLLAPMPKVNGNTGRGCPDTLTVASPETSRSFSTPALARGFTVSGNDAFRYVHEGPVPSNVDVTVDVQVVHGTEGTSIVKRTFTGDDGPGATPVSHFTVDLPFTSTTKTATFQKGDLLRVTLTGKINATSGATATSWTVNDTGSYLLVRSSDSHRAATWTEDPQENVKSLFKPYPDKTTIPPEGIPRIIGFFAVQSAFGSDDATSFGAMPQFVLEHNGQPQPVGTSENGVIAAAYNGTASSTSEGRAVWNFAAPLDYRGLPAGEYNLTATMKYHQGGGYSAGTVARILISAPSVSITPYDDQDPATSPSPLESLAHSLAPGGQTTYLLIVKNTGTSADTYRLSTSLVSASPTGWSAALAGPTVLDSTVKLEAQESALVTVTVQAPSTAGLDAQSIFQVNAQSLVDSASKPQTVTLISTVTSEARPAVGIVTPLKVTSIVAGEDSRVSVYAWNRGTRVANISLEIRNPSADWAEDFVQSDSFVKRVVLSSVAPGAIARAELRVAAVKDVGETTHEVSVNATSLDVGGVSADAIVRYAFKPLDAIQLRVLESVNGLEHLVETTTPLGPGGPLGDSTSCKGGGTGCDDNGLDGTWFRVWVTNNGKRSDTFGLSLESPTYPYNHNPSDGAPCDDEFFSPHDGNQGEFDILYRTGTGNYSVTHRISLGPGETGEVYVWRGVDRSKALCVSEDGTVKNAFYFVATGETSKVSAQTRLVATGVDDNVDRNAVLLEGVPRLNGSSSSHPVIDVSQADKRIVTQGVRPGENASFYVRVTLAASFPDYTDSNDNYHSTDVRLSLFGVNREEGWNASMRFVGDDPNAPFADTLTFTNTHAYSGRREGFTDAEIEVRVTPPDGVNRSALAGDQGPFYIKAIIGDSDSKSSTLVLRPIIVDHAKVDVSADQTRIFAHPDEPSPYLLYINNTGSSETLVTLRAKMNPNATSNPNAWTVDPASSTFPLQAFKNRTVALTVRPPAGASPGTTGQVDVTIDYAESPLAPSATVSKTIALTAEVAALGSLRLAAAQTEATIAPGGFANFTLTLSNAGGGSGGVDFSLSSTELLNWSQQIAPGSGTLGSGESRTVVYVLKAPTDVVNESSYSTIVRVVDTANDANFANVPLHVSILGGRAIAALSVPTKMKTVDRAGATSFEIIVKNVGSASGRIFLSTRSGDPAWSATILSSSGSPASFVDLAANDAALLNVSVRAPFATPEHTIVPIDVIAETVAQSASVPIQAAVHDYGVHAELSPSRLDAIAGLPTEWTVKIRNDGNDNDTLNVSALLQDIPDWNVTLAAYSLRLEPGQVGEIRATVKPPTSPLPIPRAYTLKFYASTLGGAALNLAKNETVAGIVNVLNYRAADVDKDDFLEIAVDFDKNPANGFERFVEIFPDGSQSTVVALGKVNGKTSFFLDVPRERPYDGVADVWFDPESVYTYDIRSAPDANGDNAPDYLLDTDHDGKVDKAFDTVSQSFWSVVEVRSFGDSRVQYLVDVTNDGKPDRFYDPDSKVVTRTQSVAGEANLLGLDTNNDQRVDKYYDIRANTVSDAKVFGFLDFVRQYWYFFVVFLAMVVLTIVLVARRKRVG